MPYKAKPIEKSYYSISEVAAMFDVSTSLVRFWENQFEVLKPKKNKKGNRMFTPRDVENLKKIYQLVKVKGYTLKGAKLALKNKESVDVNEQTEPSAVEIEIPLVASEPAVELIKPQPSVDVREVAEKLVRLRHGLQEILKQL